PTTISRTSSPDVSRAGTIGALRAPGRRTRAFSAAPNGGTLNDDGRIGPFAAASAHHLAGDRLAVHRGHAAGRRGAVLFRRRRPQRSHVARAVRSGRFRL